MSLSQQIAVMTVDDSLVVNIINLSSAQNVLVFYTFEKPGTGPQPASSTVAVAAGPSVTSSIILQGEGVITQLAVAPLTNTCLVGEMYVHAEIRRRGTGPNSLPIQTLIKDYTTTYNPAVWPFIGQTSFPVLRGATKIISCTDPAAAANFAYTVPNYQEWRLLAVRLTLTADANVANRIVNILIQDNNGVNAWRIACNTAITATQAKKVSFVAGMTQRSTDGDIAEPLPNYIYMRTNWVINVTVTNKQAGDQISSVTLTAIQNASSIY